MSMNATDRLPRLSATFLATVDLPLPEPPAMPIMSGFDTWRIYSKGSGALSRRVNEFLGSRISSAGFGIPLRVRSLDADWTDLRRIWTDRSTTSQLGSP